MSGWRILFVHGINPKPPPEWHEPALRRALSTGLSRIDPALDLDEPGSFELVPWSRLFYAEDRPVELEAAPLEAALDRDRPRPADVAEVNDRKRRLMRHLHLVGDRFPFLIRWVAGEKMMLSIGEAHRYFGDIGGVASRIRERLVAALHRAWGEGREVLLIGHSLGSVIAYDTLWYLSHHDERAGEVDLFTLGSPLGTRYVQARLLGVEHRGAARHPTVIRHWQNYVALGDMTAIDPRLADDFADMVSHRLVDSIEDHTGFCTWYRDVDGLLNPHKSYGYLVHPSVAAAVATWLGTRRGQRAPSPAPPHREPERTA